jgi:histidine triad (HIT) family protein
VSARGPKRRFAGGPEATSHGREIPLPHPIIKGMSCLFCGIAGRAAAAAVVFEDEFSMAFLDHRPLFPGHCLLIPKRHYETLNDLPASEVGPLFGNARTLAAAVEEALAADGSFVAVNNRVSQSVPHLHIHVVPRRRKDGLRGFFWPRGKYAGESEIESLRQAIAAAVSRLKQSGAA